MQVLELNVYLVCFKKYLSFICAGFYLGKSFYSVLCFRYILYFKQGHGSWADFAVLLVYHFRLESYSSFRFLKHMVFHLHARLVSRIPRLTDGLFSTRKNGKMTVRLMAYIM